MLLGFSLPRGYRAGVSDSRHEVTYKLPSPHFFGSRRPQVQTGKYHEHIGIFSHGLVGMELYLPEQYFERLRCVVDVTKNSSVWIWLLVSTAISSAVILTQWPKRAASPGAVLVTIPDCCLMSMKACHMCMGFRELIDLNQCPSQGDECPGYIHER
jgi:hypothetical protein